MCIHIYVCMYTYIYIYIYIYICIIRIHNHIYIYIYRDVVCRASSRWKYGGSAQKLESGAGFSWAVFRPLMRVCLATSQRGQIPTRVYIYIYIYIHICICIVLLLLNAKRFPGLPKTFLSDFYVISRPRGGVRPIHKLRPVHLLRVFLLRVLSICIYIYIYNRGHSTKRRASRRERLANR